uniref:NmrA-like domain-containing protein n=1 Tax=Spyridia filamentosa TaxID=196632 RepID=A0A1Z1MJG1_SPYFI|nr:hypothetical protein [Spyridia filamentosa]ARW66193.1 hypothetical protein [Spyridia filamentosa]
MTLLVLGATGTLGRQIVRQALNEGFQIKCFVRNFRRASFLKEWGAELIYGDLKLPETIPTTLLGVTAIIDAATARPSDLYDARQIDLKGKYILIQAAKKAQIKHYIFFSILNAYKYPNIPLMSLKASIENCLIDSRINYTVFNLPSFFQGLINQYALPVLDNQSVWITSESTPVSYVSTQDVAKMTIKSLSIQRSINKTLSVITKDSWSSYEIIQLCEKISGRKTNIVKIPVIILDLIRKLTRYFQWTWNISDRLAFVEILMAENDFHPSSNDIYEVLLLQEENLENLENYLQEYFEKIMKKLKELNYQTIQDSEQMDVF